MWEPETLDLQELGEHEGFDFEMSGEGDLFGDFEDFEDWEGGSNQFNDYETSAEASLEALEADPFLGDLVRSATQTLDRVSGGVINSQFLKNMAKQAAQVAGGAIAGKQGAQIAGQIANQVIREGSYEGSYENGNLEATLEGAGVDMEAVADLHYFANQIAEAQNEAEADEFLGALVPILGQVAAPLVSSLLNRESGDFFDEESWDGEQSRDEFLPALLPMVAPLIAKGVGAIGKMLSKRKKTRKFAAAAPRIATGAATRIAKSGKPPTPARVAAAVSAETASVLSNPRRLQHTLRQNRSIARRATSGTPPMSSRIGQRTNGYGYGYGSRAPSQSRGRMTQGSMGGRPKLIGYVPVYAKR